MEGKEIDINNEEQILKECSFDYFYNCEESSRELCMFYNDIFKQGNNFNTRQAIIDLGRIAITLNQQDKRIKELEKKLDNARQKDIIIRQNCRQGYIKDLEEMDNLREENQQLKQQLHDLPKKIVEEIIEELCNCGKTFFEDEPYIEICIVQGILDTILKKYGVENERK